MRAFIAIELPKDIKTHLAAIQDELKKTKADVKWVQTDNIHLTLKFLGEIDQNQQSKITPMLNAIAGDNPGFEVCLSALGAFPKVQYPRIIWIGLTGDEPVIKIAEAIEKQMAKIGFPKESRRFTSHITLGRVRGGLNRKALIEKLESLNKTPDIPKPGFKVTSLNLIKSTLTPKGPIYENILTCPLS